MDKSQIENYAGVAHGAFGEYRDNNGWGVPIGTKLHCDQWGGGVNCLRLRWSLLRNGTTFEVGRTFDLSNKSFDADATIIEGVARDMAEECILSAALAKSSAPPRSTSHLIIKSN